jgi:hypothetical protein
MSAVGFVSNAEALAVGRIQKTQMPIIAGRAGILLGFMAERSLRTVTFSSRLAIYDYLHLPSVNSTDPMVLIS